MVNTKPKRDWIWGLAGIVFSLGIIGSAAQVVYWGFAQDNWVPTEATVVRSQRVVMGGGTKAPRYVYRFRYQYEVGGTVFEGERFSYQYASPSPIQGVQRFAAGDPLTIYYDPRQPRRAVVEKARPSIWVYAFGALGLPFLIAGVLMIKAQFCP